MSRPTAEEITDRLVEVLAATELGTIKYQSAILTFQETLARLIDSLPPEITPEEFPYDEEETHRREREQTN